MKRFYFVALLLSVLVTTMPLSARAADVRCCNKKEDNCTINCKYSCRVLTPQAPCNAAINEEEADCFGQVWHNINAAQACVELGNSLKAEQDQQQNENDQQRVWSEITPKLQIPIGPNFQFSNLLKKDEEAGDTTTTYLYVPYLAEYFGMLYKYLIGIAGILAGVMITFGGFQWLLAAGDAGKIKHARERIVNAVIGLILALGSYTVLFLVNPDLVTFKALKVPFVQNEELETLDDPEISLANVPAEAQQATDSSAFSAAGSGSCDAASILNAGNYFKNLNMCNGPDHCIWGVSMILRQAGCYRESTTKVGLSSFASFMTKPDKGWLEKSLGENPLRKRTSSRSMVSELLQDNEFVVARQFYLPRGAHHLIIAKVAGTTYCIESNWLSSKAAAEAVGAPGCYKANLTKIAAQYKAQGKAVVSAKMAEVCNTCTKIPGHGPGFDALQRPSSDPAAQQFKVTTGGSCNKKVATAILCPPNLPGPCTRR